MVEGEIVVEGEGAIRYQGSMRIVGWWVFVLVTGILPVTAIAGRAEDWQRVAEMVPHVSYDDFLYGRASESLEALEVLMADEVGLRELKELAGHADAKVRTLALMKLFTSGDPQAFRVIHGLLGDEGVAFPAVQRFAHAFDFDRQGGLKVPPVPTTERKVGELARMMMEMLGFFRNVDFEEWAEPRLDNPDWMGWYEFLLRRVTRGTQPVPDGIGEELAEFDILLDQRPPAMRAWLGFAVADDAMIVPKEDTVLGTRDELIAAGKGLGAEVLLGFLRDGTRAGLREPKVDDAGKGQRFVLRHAKEFFRAEDADALREMGHFIAAADLRPEMAGVWLREACAEWKEAYQGWERARAMAAMLDLCGESELGFVVEWFYQTESNASGSTDQSVFITEYRRRRPEEWRVTLKALVGHAGFESLNSMDVVYLGLMLNDFEGRDLLDDGLMHEEHEADLRNAMRRVFGLAEVAVRWLDLAGGDEVVADWAVGVERGVNRLAVSADGGFLALGREDGKVEVFRVAEGAIGGDVRRVGLIPEVDGLAAMDFRRGDGRLVVIRARGMMEVWRVDVLEKVHQVQLEGFGTTEAVVDPGGRWVASRQANDDGISVYDPETGGRKWNVKTSVRAFGMIGESPDGSRFAVCDGFFRTMLLFDPMDREPVARLEGHSGVPMEAVFSADGGVLVTTGEDTKVLVWDAKTGEGISGFSSRQRGVRVRAAGEKAGEFFFAGGAGELALVDVTTGRAVRSLGYEGSWVIRVVRNGASVFAVCGKRDGELMLVRWRLPGA